MFVRSRALFIASLLVAGAAALSLPASAAQAERPCADCHKKVAAGKVVHAAMGMGCETCHAAPHARKKPELSLVKPVPELCFSCHDPAGFRKAVVHSPVAAGGCTSCHRPHASENPALLAQPLPYLCEQCHQDKSDGRHILAGYSLSSNHPTRGRKDPSWKGRELSCRSCHEPHASAWSALAPGTAASGGLTCRNCHSRVTVRP